MAQKKKNNKNLTAREASAVQAALLPGRHTLQFICNKARCSKTEALRGMEKALQYGGSMYHGSTDKGVPLYWFTASEESAVRKELAVATHE